MVFVHGFCTCQPQSGGVLAEGQQRQDPLHEPAHAASSAALVQQLLPGPRPHQHAGAIAHRRSRVVDNYGASY